MTLVRDVLARDITSWEIPNLGVAQVGVPSDEQGWKILRHELESFVADGEYGAGLDRILSTYLNHLGRESQPAAWVSGFYGSGKSHLVRVLESLWVDRELPGGARAQGLVQLPDDIRAYLRELETRSRQAGGRFSAPGHLSASGTSVGLAILAVIFAAAGLPEDIAAARLVLWLRKEQLIEPVTAHLASSGRSLESELPDLYVSDHLAAAIVAARPGLANSTADMLQLLRVEYPSVGKISEHEFLEVFERTLRSTTPEGRLPLTLIVLDELQQFIADDNERALEVQHLVEAISAKFESKVLVVATGQMALASTTVLQKLIDRFRVNVSLRDKDVDQVVRSVVLRKLPERQREVADTLDQASGEIDRHLAGSAIAPSAADKPDLVADYPLLPARRRLWERILRAADTSGRSGQLRTQLRIVLDATKSVADRPLGVVVAGDRIYDDLESSLQQSGALPNVTAQLIASLDDGTERGRLEARVAKVVYLLGRLPTDGPLATGLRATPDTIADLLVEDLRADGARLRERVPNALESLAARSVLQKVEGAYILRTPEGAEWDAEFRAHEADLSTDSRWHGERRDQLLREAFAEVERSIRPRQGASQTSRKAKAFYGPDEPVTSGEVPIWVRDEWSVSERSVKEDAQRLDTSSPIVSVWIPRDRSDQLKAAMVEAEAAKRTIERRAVPATQDGKDARQGLISRRDDARQREVAIAKQMLAAARVYQAGGNEVTEGSSRDTFEPSLRKAVDNAVLRLYPDFGPADHTQWDRILRRVREGSADPFAPIGHRGDVDEHPVGKVVLAHLGGGGKRGMEVRKQFEAPPYGWPGDAVDATLLALVAGGKAQGRYGGEPLDPRRLPQNQLGSADFRAESVIVKPSDRMRLRGLATSLGVTTSEPDTEIARAILKRLRELADAAGGDPPMPARPSLDEIRELEGLTGNAQVLAISEAKQELEQAAADWKTRAAKIPERRDGWEKAQRLARHAAALPGTGEAAAQLAAVEADRTLLDEPDPVAPITTLLAEELRAALSGELKAFATARDAGIAEIEANPAWGTLTQSQRDEIVARVGLTQRGESTLGTVDEILRTLDATPLADWGYRIDAVPAQVHRAQVEIAKLTTKAPTPVTIPRAIIKDPADLEHFFDDVRKLVQPHLDKDETVAI